MSYCLSWMGGEALAWGMAEFTNQSDCASTFEKFTKELELMFNPAAVRRVSASRWFRLSQGARTVSEYALEFRTLAAKLGYAEKVLCDRFYDGLADKIKDELVGQELPATLRPLIELAVKVGLRFQARAAERETRRSTQPPQQAEQRRGSGAWPREAFSHTPLTEFGRSVQVREDAPHCRTASPHEPRRISATTKPLGPGEPMELGQFRLQPRERERRRASGLCMYCGAAGHFVKDCPGNDSAC